LFFFLITLGVVIPAIAGIMIIHLITWRRRERLQEALACCPLGKKLNPIFPVRLGQGLCRRLRSSVRHQRTP